MLDAKPCPTLMSCNTNLSLHDGVTFEKGSDYCSFVGVLQYWHISFWSLPLTFPTPTSLAIRCRLSLPHLFRGHLPNKSGILVQHRIRVPREANGL
ncbi:hypothetical protein AAG906_013343 [Vitis piasezkii]